MNRNDKIDKWQREQEAREDADVDTSPAPPGPFDNAHLIQRLLDDGTHTLAVAADRVACGEWVSAAWRVADCIRAEENELAHKQRRVDKLRQLGLDLRVAAAQAGVTVGIGLTMTTGFGGLLPLPLPTTKETPDV